MGFAKEIKHSGVLRGGHLGNVSPPRPGGDWTEAAPLGGGAEPVLAFYEMRLYAQAVPMQARLRYFSVRRRSTTESVFASHPLWCALLILAGVLLSASRPLMAADGRDFAGSYQLTDLVDQGDTIVATFTTRVFNYSDADVSDATVVLDSRLVPG